VVLSVLRRFGILSRSDEMGAQSMMNLRRQEIMVAYLFIAPAVILFLIFVAGPVLFSLGLSLFKWNIFQPAEFVGLENFSRFGNDTRVLTGFRNTAVFTGLVVWLDVVVALILAVALQHRLPAVLRYFYRTSFFLPVVTSVAAISVVLGFMLDTHLGMVNYYLGLLGIERVRWLDSSNWALISLIITTVWKTFGFDLILFTAGIQNIPKHYYEAAEIDGANAWQKFRNITLPQLSPTILFVVVVGLISHFQMFDQANVMTAGGPGYASTTVVMVIWDSLSSLRLGYGSTIATISFTIILMLTIVQFWLSRRWVYYEGER